MHRPQNRSQNNSSAIALEPRCIQYIHIFSMSLSICIYIYIYIYVPYIPPYFRYVFLGPPPKGYVSFGTQAFGHVASGGGEYREGSVPELRVWPVLFFSESFHL